MEEDDINVSPPEAATPTSAHDPSSASEDTASSPKPRWVVTVAALLRKNILLLWSSKIALLLIIFFPTLGVGLTRIIDKLTESSPGSSYDYNQDYIDQITAITMVDAGAPFGKCQWFDVYGDQTKAPKTECVTLLFSADNYDNVDDINNIMASIAEEAGVAFSPMAPESSSAAFPQLPFRQEIFGFSSLLSIGEFLVANPGRAGGVVVFRASDGNKLVVDTWYNITGFPPNYLGNNRPETVLQLRAALGRGLLKTTLGQTEVDVVIRSRKLVDSTYTDQSNISVDTDDYYSYGSTSSLSVGAYLLGIILALSYMLSSVLLVSFISREKQEGLIGSLRVVGMTDTAYWTSWLIIGVTNVVSSSLLAMIMAYILEVPVLTDSDFITPWLLVIVSGICMYAFATITVGLVTQRRAVNGLQFVAIILILVSANFGTFSTATKNDTAGRALLALFPGFILQFVSQHIAFYPSLAGNNKNVTLTYTFATLFERVGDCNSTILDAEGRCEYVQRFDNAGCWRYADCGIGGSVDSFYCAPDDCYYFQPPDAFLIVIMILQTFVYLSLTWYFFKVIPSGNGIHRKLSFLCSPRYWRRKLPSSDGSTGTDQQLSGEEKSIRIRGISKVFGAHKAIDDISLDMANGQVFVMLGHNGAGKTTLINMLTGKMSPSSGDAYIMGHSVIHNVECIQELVGSVPQHDLLWSELSAYEHVRLFATIKGIISSSEDVTREVAIARILRKVHLEKEANQAAGGYSGGMKRRLSIALAGVGSPAILFMDEPTTGIDPLNRRRIWKLIQELKKGKVIVLTTHLMQEADSLGDYVAILDHGKIQAEGTPLNLKTEYGSGYSLNLITDVDKVDRVCELAKEAIPGVHLVNSSAGSVAIGIPKNGLEKVPQLTRDLQDEELIREWSVSQSTLEEVFLRLVKHDTALQVTEPSSSSPSNLVEGEQIPAEPDNLNDAINLAVEEGQMEPTFATKHAWILQIRSLLWKTFLLQRRSIVGSLVLFVIPILSLVLLNVKLFKPLKPPTSIYDGYIILYPQAMALIGFPQSPPCDFFWYVSSSLDGTLDSVNYHTTPLGIVGAFEARQAPPGAIDDRDNEYYVTLEWSMSISSNVTLAEVESALQFAFREELKRANSPATQSLADARCNGEHCGPCRVDTSSLNVVIRDDNMFLFSLPGIYSSNSLPACQSTVGECPLNAVRFAMLQGSFMSTLSQQLNSPASLVATPSYTYRDSFESVEKVVTLESTSLGENSGSSFYNLGTGYCLSCDDKKPALVWISGDGAASFAGLYIGEDTEIIVKNTDVLELVLTGRKHLETQSQVFGTTTFSSCAVLKNRGNYYENVRDERGWIVNMDAPTPITNFSANCDSVEEQRDAYKLLFPDAGFQVMSFDLIGDKVVVDITSLVYDASGGYGLEVYNINDQAVFSVHCEASDLNGTCLPDSNLICAMTTPPIAAGCSLPQYRTAGSALVESTYNAIIGAVIPGGTLKVNTQPTTSTTLITYVPALKTDDLALIAALFALFIAMLMPLISSTIVAEKHQRYVFAMLLNGLSLVNYWVATYIFHAVMCWIVVLFATTLALAMGLPPFEGLSYGHFFFVIITYIHAQFGFTALLSICFSKERFASILLSLGSVVLFGIAWVMLAAVQPILNHWSGLFSLIPMLGASRAFFLLFWNQHLPEVTTICGIFLGSGTLYLMIAIYAHGATGVGALWKPHCSCKHQNAEGNTGEEKASTDADDEMEGHDLDVRREALRALGLSPSEVAIKVAHLGKTFPARPLPKNAVVDVSMAMDYGEIFGLLGPNGAGKTTVISMLVGQLDPSRGATYVAGYHSVDQRQDALKQLGIVPQFDVLYPNLSVKEHLQMYAAIKGVVNKDNLNWALHIAEKVALGGDLFDKPSKNLSGGMKRRLSIAIALLSDPKILFLDEPTTGLDPDMKRSIWEIVERMREGRCIILTTHAMDEAEALCDRIGIMAQGSLKCVGTPSHLRQRYGSTFELTFTVSLSEDSNALDEFLKTYSTTATLVSAFGQTRVFTMDKDQMDLTSLFTMLLKGQEDNFYTEWGISNTSLDEVFCAITAASEGANTNEF